MLIAGNFVLNKSQHPRQHTIYPFVHQSSNVKGLEDQFRAVMIPGMVLCANGFLTRDRCSHQWPTAWC